MAEYQERLDPVQESTRIPSNQSWAIDMIASEGTGLADRGVRANALREAASALSVPRGPLVLRRLSALRRELREGDLTPAAAVLGVLETIEREGLRPVDGESGSRPSAITRERVRLVCYRSSTAEPSVESSGRTPWPPPNGRMATRLAGKGLDP